MLESLTLRNFKAFNYQDIQLRPLTLLAGLNGMGKSTVLQSLLLLRQSYQQRVLVTAEGSGLVLNGDLAQLGTGRDVLFDSAEKDEIGFTLEVRRKRSFAGVIEYDRLADVLRFLPDSKVSESGLTQAISSLTTSTILKRNGLAHAHPLTWPIFLSVNTGRLEQKANMLSTS